MALTIMSTNEAELLPKREQLLDIIRLQTNIAQLGLDLGSVMALVVDRTLTLTGADGAAIELAEGEEMVYRAASGIAAVRLGMRLNIASSLSGQCVRSGQMMICNDTETDPRVDIASCRQIGIRSMLVLPLLHLKLCVGVLKIMSRQPHAFDEQHASVLQLLTEVLGAEIFFAAKYATDDLFYRATHDEMTGLANRALFLDRLHHAVAHTKRSGTPLGVLMIDMDGLKAINDRFGHRAGDQAIRAFAERLRGILRNTDTIARLGGDEFAVLMQPVPDTATLFHNVERLQAHLNLPYPELDFTVAGSVGLAMAPLDGIEPEILLEKADQAMYIVKREHKRH